MFRLSKPFSIRTKKGKCQAFPLKVVSYGLAGPPHKTLGCIKVEHGESGECAEFLSEGHVEA